MCFQIGKDVVADKKDETHLPKQISLVILDEARSKLQDVDFIAQTC